jgi:hypothetical protein
MHKTAGVLFLLLISFAAIAQAQQGTITLACKGSISSLRADGSPIGEPFDGQSWRMTLDFAAGKVALEPWSPSQIDDASGSTIKFSRRDHNGPRGNIDRVTGDTWVETGDPAKLTTHREGTCRPVQRLF